MLGERSARWPKSFAVAGLVERTSSLVNEREREREREVRFALWDRRVMGGLEGDGMQMGICEIKNQ